VALRRPAARGVRDARLSGHRGLTEPLDIAVAGCGIAGLAAALLLHRQGHAVALYERFEAPRPLGSGLMLQPTGLAVLAELGLADEVIAHAAPIHRIHGRNTLGETVLDARYADLGTAGQCGYGIHRASLFGALYDAVLAAGIAIRTGHDVAGSELTATGRRLLFAAAEPSAAYDLVVDTLGVASPLVASDEGWLPFGALWTTLEWPADGPFRAGWLEQRYERARKMAGVLPTGKRRGTGRDELALFWSLRADQLERWRGEGLAAWKAEFRALWPDCAGLLERIADPAELTFARYAHRTHRRPFDERLIHIGDAWHSASPQLGQGANMALLDAWALARTLGQEGSVEERLTTAIALRRSHVRLYQWLTALFTPAYQSDSVWPALIRDLILAPLSRIPPGPRVQADMVSGLTGGPLGPLGLMLRYPSTIRAEPR
jgi:2-polyprenyl-6-methoxyphenol hydroxylase-like FAD-dependent oxidoreductase